MNWYLKVLQHYGDFNGRARRTEYWMFVLFNIIFAIIAVSLDYLFGLAITNLGYGPIYMIYGLIVLLPGIAVGVRRLHDIGKSGWMLLVGLIPIIGGIWIFILMVTDSEPGPNEYGPNPKETEEV